MSGWKKACNYSTTPEPFPSGSVSVDFSAEKLCSLSLCPFILLGSFSFTSYASFVPLFWIINSSGSKTHLPGVVRAVPAVLVPLMYSSNPLCLTRSLKRCDKTSNAAGKYFSIPLGALESSLLMFSVSLSYFHMDNAVSSLLQRIWALYHQLRFWVKNTWISVPEFVWMAGPGVLYCCLAFQCCWEKWK